MKTFKKIFSIFLIAVMIVMELPVQALAESFVNTSVSMQNSFIKVVVNNSGRFAVRTVDGQPIRKNDNNTGLTFSEDDTSFTTFKITAAGKTAEYIFGNGYDLIGGYKAQSAVTTPYYSQDTDGKQTITTRWTLSSIENLSGNIEILQTITLNADKDSTTSGMVFVDYQVTNNTSASIEIGSRVLLDTMVGTNDGPAFQNGSTQENVTTVERTLYRKTEEGMTVDGTVLDKSNINYYTMQNYFMMRDSGGYQNPLATNVYAYGFNMVGAPGETDPSDAGHYPDKMVVGHWAHLANSKYDITVNPNLDFTTETNDYGSADTAVAYFWDDDTIAAKGIRSYRVVYGIGEILSEDNEFNITFIDQKSELETNDEKSAYLNDGVFEIAAQVQCSENSENEHSYVVATLTLENGLDFVETLNGRVVYDENGKPKTTGERSQTSTYTKTITDLTQDSNPFKAGDMCVFRYKVVATGKAWPQTKEYSLEVTSDTLEELAMEEYDKLQEAYNTAQQAGINYEMPSVSLSSVKNDFIFLPAVGDLQQTRVFALTPEKAYYTDEKIVSVGVTNFGAYNKGEAGANNDYPSRNFDVYFKNKITGDRYLINPKDITLSDKDGANGLFNIDYLGGTKIAGTNANYAAEKFDYSDSNKLKNDPTLPEGAYNIEIRYSGSDMGEEEKAQLCCVSTAEFRTTADSKNKLRSGGYLVVARRYKKATQTEYDTYVKMMNAFNQASKYIDGDNAIQYTVQTSGRYIPYYDVQVLANESAVKQYKEDIDTYKGYARDLEWTSGMEWNHGEVVLEIKGRVKVVTDTKTQKDTFVVDTSAEQAVINNTINYSGENLTLNFEDLYDVFKARNDFTNSYEGYFGKRGSTPDSNHYQLAGNGKLKAAGSQYTFYNGKFCIDFYDGFAKTLYLNDRDQSDYSDQFSDCDVYDVDQLTSSQTGYKAHINGSTSSQTNPMTMMAEGDVYINQLSIPSAKMIDVIVFKLNLIDFRLAALQTKADANGNRDTKYLLKMAGTMKLIILDGQVSDVAYDPQGYYGLDFNLGFDIWKNIGFLQPVSSLLGDQNSQTTDTKKTNYGGKFVEAGIALLVRYYKNRDYIAVEEKAKDVFAFSMKAKLPCIGGFMVGFNFKEVDDGRVLPDNFAFRYYAPSSSSTKGSFFSTTRKKTVTPGIQVYDSIYITQIRAAVRNLADTIAGKYGGTSIPLTICAGVTLSKVIGPPSRFGQVQLVGNVDLMLKMSGIKIYGDLSLEYSVLTVALVTEAVCALQWADPGYFQLKATVDVAELGIIVGKTNFFIGKLENGDFSFDGWVSAVVTCPEAVPVVGGMELLKIYFGVNIERITAGINILEVGLNICFTYDLGVPDGIEFWIDNDGTPQQPALAYILNTDEDTGHQSVIVVGSNMAYVASTDYDPEQQKQQIEKCSLDANNQMLIFRSAGLGGITHEGEVYSIPVGEKVYSETEAKDALVEIEYLEDVPSFTAVSMGGITYELVENKELTETSQAVKDDIHNPDGTKLYYFTQERTAEGTTQKYMYLAVPYEKMEAKGGTASVLQLTTSENYDMALISSAKVAQINDVSLTQSGNQITFKADARYVEPEDTVKFFLTQEGSSGAIEITEELKTNNGVKKVTYEDQGALGMLIGTTSFGALSANGSFTDNVWAASPSAVKSVEYTISDITNCDLFGEKGINLHEKLESGDYYLRAFMDSAKGQGAKQTANFIKLADPKAPAAVKNVNLEPAGKGEFEISFDYKDGNNASGQYITANAFRINFYDDKDNDYDDYTDLIVEMDNFTTAAAADGFVNYSARIGKRQEVVVTEFDENSDAENNNFNESVSYVGCETSAKDAVLEQDKRYYKAKVFAANAVTLDDGSGDVKYHYSAGIMNGTNASVIADAKAVELPYPVEPAFTLSTDKGTFESYYKYGDGDYRTTPNDTFAYYKLLTTEESPVIKITPDCDAKLSIYDDEENLMLTSGGKEAAEITLKKGETSSVKLTDIAEDDSSLSFGMYLENTANREYTEKTLKIVVDKTAPVLYIDQPTSTSQVKDGKISFSGNTNASDSTVTVYVDGSSSGTVLSVDENGVLSGIVPVKTDKSIVSMTVIAKDAAGNHTDAELTVLNGDYKVASNIVVRSYKSGSATKLETVARYANGKKDDKVVYTEEVLSGDVSYSVYRGDATLNGTTVNFGKTDASIIKAVYAAGEGTDLEAYTVVRQALGSSGSTTEEEGTVTPGQPSDDDKKVDVDPNAKEEEKQEETAAAGGGGGGGGGGGAAAKTEEGVVTVSKRESNTTVNKSAAEVSLNTTDNVITVDVTGTKNDAAIVSEFNASGYEVKYAEGTSLTIDTPLFKAEIPAENLGSEGTVKIESIETAELPVNSNASTALAGTGISLGGSGNQDNPVSVSLRVPDTVSINDVTAVILYDKDGNMTPLPFKLNMVGSTAYMDVLLTDEGTVVFEKCSAEFKDVTEKDWSYDAIMSAAGREILLGVKAGIFDRTSPISRSAFATILMRTGGFMTKDVSVSLKDVKKGDWDYQALAAANEMGIITGYEDGKIHGDDSVSRFQAMAMVGRILNAMGLTEELAEGEADEILKSFPDAKDLEAWQKSGAAICVKAGIINGDNGKLAGNKSLTREQCATIANKLNNLITDKLIGK